MLDIKFVYQNREGTYTRFANGDWAEEVDYKPFGLLDGKLTYKRKNLLLFISAANILNTSYYDIGNVVQPGRWIKTGISYKLDFN